MKINYKPHHQSIVQTFLATWLEPDHDRAKLFAMDECEPIYLDTDDIDGSIMELNRVGFAESAKRIFQGDHFYRSDTLKCQRCYRYRPELYHDSLKGLKHDLCDRCDKVVQ